MGEKGITEYQVATSANESANSHNSFDFLSFLNRGSRKISPWRPSKSFEKQKRNLKEILQKIIVKI